MAEAKRDQNFVPTLIGASSVDGITPVTIYVDPVTHRLKVDLSGAGSGSVTSVSVVSANGFAGTVATPSTTPAITLTTTVTGILEGNGTAISAASTTGTGNVVLAGSPTLTTPNLGTPTAITLTNATGLPIAGITGLGTGVSTALANAVNGTNGLVTFSGDLGTPTAGVLTNATGLPISTGVTGLGTGVATALGVNVGSAGAFITFNGNAGTPSALTLTNATGLPISTGVSGLGSGIATFLATPSSANLAAAVTGETGSGALVFGTSPSLVTPDLGTPSAATLTNATGLPISTGVSGLGTNVATFLATPSSANLRSALTDETGTGSAVFAGSPTFTGVTTHADIQVNGHIYADGEVDNGNSGTADTIDWGAGNFQKSTLTGNVTYTFTAPDGPGRFQLLLEQDATGSRTATWPASVQWPGGTAPTLTTAANAIDIITFYYDGTDYYGVESLNFS
jgi:hypothetical protein